MIILKAKSNEKVVCTNIITKIANNLSAKSLLDNFKDFLIPPLLVSNFFVTDLKEKGYLLNEFFSK